MPTIEQAHAELTNINNSLAFFDGEALTKGTLTSAQLEVLLSDIHSDRISTRGSGNNKLSYVEAHDIKAMLIRIFGFANFSADVIHTEVVDIDRTWKNAQGKEGVRVSAYCTVRVTILSTGATYTESAACDQAGTQGLGEVMDFAIKTAESDALKRCAIYLGTQFGLSLYNGGSLADTVEVVLSPAQKQVFDRLNQRRMIQAWLASQPNGGQLPAQQPAGGQPTQSPQQGGPTPQMGAEGSSMSDMQAAFNQGANPQTGEVG